MSLDDCEALTWSLGWTVSRRAARAARVASTSFMFMLDEVPEPVWYTSTGNSPSHRPAATSAATAWMAGGDRRSMTSSRAFSDAAAPLIGGPARRSATARSACPEMGKFSTARCVWACHLALGRDPDLAHGVVLDAEVAHHGDGSRPPISRLGLDDRRAQRRRGAMARPAGFGVPGAGAAAGHAFLIVVFKRRWRPRGGPRSRGRRLRGCCA